VAAAAEEAGLTLLHCDRDFEAIARTTGQPVRMIDLRQ
jgi:predicted nucleic acid-binding protein